MHCRALPYTYCIQSNHFKASPLAPHSLCSCNQYNYCICEYICAHKTCCYKETDFVKSTIVQRCDCILVYGSTTKGDVVKRSDCILVYGSTTKGDVVKRSDCILVYGSTTKGDVVKRCNFIMMMNLLVPTCRHLLVLRLSSVLLVSLSTFKRGSFFWIFLASARPRLRPPLHPLRETRPPMPHPE